MLSIITNIPNVNIYPLTYVFEHMKLQHKPNTLWLEFGVASGKTINYISKFTNDKVYGFDSFEGYLKNGAMVLIKAHLIEMVIYHKLIATLN
jgi:hypothetical protein